MKLTKTSAMAALAMAFLANRGDQQQGVIQARQVAEYLGAPTDSALKILQNLARHRLIQSQLGRGGGYRLNRPAHQITLLEIVEAIDGPVEADMPLGKMDTGVAARLRVLNTVCEQAAQHVRRELASITVARLAATESASAWRN